MDLVCGKKIYYFLLLFTIKVEADLRLEEADIEQLPGLALAEQENPHLVPHLVKVSQHHTQNTLIQEFSTPPGVINRWGE